MIETGLPTVTQDRLAAAQKLYRADAEWQAMEQAFDELRIAYPSNQDLKAVLLKASVVNALYATNVFAIRAMARHICDVFSTGSDVPDVQLVPRIAELAVGG
jgi:predicted transcriptional regulator YheO